MNQPPAGLFDTATFSLGASRFSANDRSSWPSGWRAIGVKGQVFILDTLTPVFLSFTPWPGPLRIGTLEKPRRHAAPRAGVGPNDLAVNRSEIQQQGLKRSASTKSGAIGALPKLSRNG